MKQLTCEMCGSTDVVKQGEYFVCQVCGCKYTVETAKKMMIEGVVEVKGTVKVDGRDSELQSALDRGYAYLEDEKWEKATETFNKALDINVKCSDAYLGLLMVDKHISTVDELIKSTSYYVSYENYSKAKQYANKKTKEILNKYESNFIIKQGVCYTKDGKACVTAVNQNVQNIIIPDSVTVIKKAAFLGCAKLTSVTLPNSLRAIEDNAFYNCKLLKSITIPDSVINIGEWAFYGCKLLKSITIPNSIINIGNRVFDECSIETATLPAKAIKSLKKESLQTVVITKGCIEDEAFSECGNLTSVTIGDDVTSIGDKAFYNCYSLANVTIGDGVTSIGENAFEYCEVLTSVTIGKSVTTIGGSAFYNCSNLTEIEIPDSVKSLGDRAFCGCKNLLSVTIGNGVTSIVDYTFNDCSSLKSVTMGNSLTSIGYMSFYNCSSLTNVTIPNSVTSIDGTAFSNCSQLKLSGNTKAHKKSNGGCYVATCVYGSYDCPEVWTLRRFRDNTLGSTWYGRAFIKLYYAISPTLVKWFGKTKWFKKMWKGALDRMVKNLQEKGVENTPYEDKNW